MEVVGERELAFYPGVCRGCAFSGFVYHSEAGAKAVELNVSKTALSGAPVPDIFRSYYNGGGVFVDAPKYQDKGVEILASFTAKPDVDAGEGDAAVVYCKVGDGAAILTSPHPELVHSLRMVLFSVDQIVDLPLLISITIKIQRRQVSPISLRNLQKMTS